MITKTLPSGLLIQDVSDHPLQQRIADCCERYKAKFGAWPVVLWAHPDTLDGFHSPNGLLVEADKRILRNHYLVGPLPDRET